MPPTYLPFWFIMSHMSMIFAQFSVVLTSLVAVTEGQRVLQRKLLYQWIVHKNIYRKDKSCFNYRRAPHSWIYCRTKTCWNIVTKFYAKHSDTDVLFWSCTPAVCGRIMSTTACNNWSNHKSQQLRLCRQSNNSLKILNLKKLLHLFVSVDDGSYLP